MSDFDSCQFILIRMAYVTDRPVSIFEKDVMWHLTSAYMQWVYGRSAFVRYVMTKFSRMDSLPNFLTHGAPMHALCARELRYYIISSYNLRSEETSTAFGNRGAKILLSTIKFKPQNSAFQATWLNISGDLTVNLSRLWTKGIDLTHRRQFSHTWIIDPVTHS